MGNAYIYIMTNKTFSGHNWVKIGYAKDVEKRRRQLSTTNIPYPYEVYATYEIPESTHLGDKVLHKIITNLNPNLRLSANREFFEMSPEQAYDLLSAMAIIHNREDKLVICKKEKTIIKTLQVDNTKTLPITTKEELYIKSQPGNAILIIQDDQYIVKKNSIIRINLKQNNPALRELQQDIQNGLITISEQFGVLNQDKYFKSPSGAAKYVMGCSVNGWITWKTASGKNLEQYLSK